MAHNPQSGKPMVLGTTRPDLPNPSFDFRATVATAGSIFVEYDSAPGRAVELSLGAGVHYEPGHFTRIWAPAGIVLDPAATITAYGPSTAQAAALGPTPQITDVDASRP